MKDLILCLLRDSRMDILVQLAPEFRDTRHKLQRYLEVLDHGFRLMEPEEAFVCHVEKTMQIILPHLRKIQVNGEDVDVLFVMKGDLCAYPSTAQ